MRDLEKRIIKLEEFVERRRRITSTGKRLTKEERDQRLFDGISAECRARGVDISNMLMSAQMQWLADNARYSDPRMQSSMAIAAEAQRHRERRQMRKNEQCQSN